MLGSFFLSTISSRPLCLFSRRLVLDLLAADLRQAEARRDHAAQQAGEEPRMLEHLGLERVDAAAGHAGKRFVIEQLAEPVQVGDGDGVGGGQRSVHAVF